MAQGATANDYMTRDLITLRQDMDIHRAIKLLVDNRISGAPVLDENANLAGILSTRDCLQVAFSASYHQDSGGRVMDYMTRKVETIDVMTEIVQVADLFLKNHYRRLPVTENGRLVGLISRYDVLKALEDLW